MTDHRIGEARILNGSSLIFNHCTPYYFREQTDSRLAAQGHETQRLSAATLGDPRALRTALLSVIGTEGLVYPRQEWHLAAALLKCTPTPPRLYHRQPHLGWSSDGLFLIPGRLPADMTLAVASDVPYRLEPAADLALALKALAALLRAHDLRRTTIAALAAFTPPLVGLVGWRRLRYALFIAGVTGSLKSCWCIALMGVWGRRFRRGDRSPNASCQALGVSPLQRQALPDRAQPRAFCGPAGHRGVSATDGHRGRQVNDLESGQPGS